MKLRQREKCQIPMTLHLVIITYTVENLFFFLELGEAEPWKPATLAQPTQQREGGTQKTIDYEGSFALKMILGAQS